MSLNVPNLLCECLLIVVTVSFFSSKIFIIFISVCLLRKGLVGCNKTISDSIFKFVKTSSSTSIVDVVFFDKIWEDEDMPKKYYANITLRANGGLVKLPDQTEEDFKKNVLLFDFYFIAQLVIFIGIPILYMIIV